LSKQNWMTFIWSAVLALLLFATMTQLLPIAIWLISVPILVIAAREKLSLVPIYIIPALVVAYVLSGGFGLFTLLVALFFLPGGIVMGALHRKRASARNVVTLGAVTVLGVMLVWLVTVNAMGSNLIGEFRKLMQSYYQNAEPLLKGVVPQGGEQAYLDMLIGMLPVLLILFAVCIAFLTHGLGRWLLSVTGTQAQRLRPMREWMLPKSLVWIYVIVLVANMFVAPGSKSVLPMLVLNLYPLLLLAFSLQAISFLFYISYIKGWGRTLPILGIVLLIIFMPAIFVFSFLGLLDAAFPLRERFNKKN